MAFVAMASAVAGTIASSAEYNKVVGNVNDLNTRLILREGTAASNTQNTSGTTTSGTYTATLSGGTTCSFTFVAPGSGSVIVNNNCNVANSGANLSLCGFEIRAGGTVGSGTVVFGVDNNESLIAGQTQANISRSRLITGLTPGSTYNIRQLFAVTGGTGTFSSKHLNVVPA